MMDGGRPKLRVREADLAWFQVTICSLARPYRREESRKVTIRKVNEVSISRRTYEKRVWIRPV